jgi:hypothetical protein
MTVVDTSRLNQSFEPSNTDVDGTSNPGETTTTTVTNTTGAVTSVPTSRTISFTITSSPIGASILLGGVDTKFITPHVMKFEETELLTPKIITVVNGTNNSQETYILSSEVITTTTGMSTNNNSNGNNSNGNNSGRGNSNGGGADSDNSTNPSDTNFRPELAPGSRPTGNAQR